MSTSITRRPRLVSGAALGTQTFNFNIATATGDTAFGAVVKRQRRRDHRRRRGYPVNTQLATYGISASIATDGTLQFGAARVHRDGGALANGATGGAVATAASTAINTANYTLDSATALTERPRRVGRSSASRLAARVRRPSRFQGATGQRRRQSPCPAQPMRTPGMQPP